MNRPICRKRTFRFALVAGVLALFAGLTAVAFEQRLANQEPEPDAPYNVEDFPSYDRAAQAHDARVPTAYGIWVAAVAAAVVAGTCAAAGWATSPAGNPLKLFVVAGGLALVAGLFVAGAARPGPKVLSGPPSRYIRNSWRRQAGDRLFMATAAALAGNAMGMILVARRRPMSGPHREPHARGTGFQPALGSNRQEPRVE